MSSDDNLWRDRKQRKELTWRLQSDNPGPEIVHPHAAGIDVGNSAHYVTMRPDRDPQTVRCADGFPFQTSNSSRDFTQPTKHASA